MALPFHLEMAYFTLTLQKLIVKHLKGAAWETLEVFSFTILELTRRAFLRSVNIPF